MKPLNTTLATLLLTACTPVLANEFPRGYCIESSHLVGERAQVAASRLQEGYMMQGAFDDARVTATDAVPNLRGMEQRDIINNLIADATRLLYMSYTRHDPALSDFGNRVRIQVYDGCMTGFYGRDW